MPTTTKSAASKAINQGTKAMNESAKVFDEAFESIRKATEANVEVQQEFFRMWTDQWTKASEGKPTNDWTESMKKVQGEWQQQVQEMLEKRREVIEMQYRSATSAMEGALELAQSSSPEEYGSKAQELCRSSLDAIREGSEAQLEEFQSAVKSFVDMFSKMAPQT